MKMFSMFNNKQPFMKMFRRKRNNNGVMWASILSLAVSAIAMLLRRGQKNNTIPSLRNFVNNIPVNNNISMMNDAALTEFSEELVSKTIQNQ